MVEINNISPAKIIKTTPFSFTLALDSSSFSDYTRQGTCENIKMPVEVSYHDWATSVVNPQASAEFGELMMTDFGKFGRSEQLHVALGALLAYVEKHNAYPDASKFDECLELAKAFLASTQLKSFGADIEINEDVLKNAISFAGCSISPMAAFFGGVIAQEIVKKTGKYTPLR